MTSNAIEIDFGLEDIFGDAPVGELEQWAAEQLMSKPSNLETKVGAAFDIETGTLDEDELRAMYAEPTWEEFSASCDQALEGRDEAGEVRGRQDQRIPKVRR